MKAIKSSPRLTAFLVALVVAVCSQAASARVYDTEQKQTSLPFLSPIMNNVAFRGMEGAHLIRPINDYAVEQPPHLQVTFDNGRVEHVAVANGGVEGNKRINWIIHGAIANWETNWDPSYSVPVAGSFYQFDAPFYIGEVSNGCGNVGVFPIDFYSEIYYGDQTFGFFDAVDVETIQPNGYWKFAYTIRIYDAQDRVSDIKVTGDVSAVCVW